MKKSIITLLLVALATTVSAQKNDLDFSKAEFVKPGAGYSVNGLSASSAFLYMDLKSGKEGLAEKYDFVSIGGKWHVVALIDINSDKLPKLEAFGVSVNGGKKAAKFKSLTIPVEQFVSFVEANIADFVDVGDKADIQMDSARYYSHADWAQAGSNGSNITLPKGYCGKDIVVGIVDIGFDYTHRNFWDSTETVFRVKRVWDQNNNGTAPSGYGYGNELKTQASILAALYSHNNETHGSHVAGIAGGGGTNDTNIKRYKGMAPESDLVFVATRGNTSRLFDGITYILDYADSVGKPCVINLSWGSQVGPHDGTAGIDQNCDYLLDSFYTEGSLIVISAGNDGAKPLHQSKTFSSNDTVLRTFMVTSSYGNRVSNYLDIWGQVGNTFAAKISIVDTTNGNVIATTRFNLAGLTNAASGTVSVSNCDIDYYNEPSSYLNGKPHIQLYIDNSGETVTTRKVMIEVIATQGTIHEWAYSAYLSSCNRQGAVAGNTNFTINAWGQGNRQIMVASHNTKRYWQNAGNGYWYHIPTATATGARSYFSSIGPSLGANLIKPDIAAPGSMIVSSYNYGNSYQGHNLTSYVYITDSIPNGNHYSLFGAMQGTSMAAPACAGILALWLEAYPYLTPAQAKYIFQNHSIVDSITGTIPATGSVYYGRGKIDAFAGLNAILQKIAKPAITPSSDTVICSGNSITLTAPTGYAKYYWSNGDTTRSITVSTAGSYCVRAVSAEGFRTTYSDTIHVTVNPYVNVILSHDTTICSGQSVTLSATGGSSRAWNTGQTTSSITVSPTTTTAYSVTVSQSNHCSVTDTITVTVHPYVSTTIGRDTAICIGDSVTLAISGGRSYLWNTGDTTATITVTPSTTTTYNVVSSAPNYCDKTDSINVEVSRYVTPSISNDTHVCPYQPVTLTAGGGDSYYWLNPAQQTTQNVTVVPQITTTYMVRIDSTGLCSAIDSVTVYTYPMPHVEITGDTGDVQNYSATLTATGAQTYLWNTGDTTASITVSPIVFTRYSVVGTTQYGCVDSASTRVKCLETSIATADGLQFRVYPNPVSPKSKLTVEGSDIETITVYNMLGKEVAKISADGESHVVIPVKDYAQGVYVISVTNSKGQTGRSTFIVR
ncbi:MAG: S8 family peptidase [Bacteroidales bacterium]|nr:S8 family peptidase [Bacteroidales bacterium]